MCPVVPSTSPVYLSSPLIVYSDRGNSIGPHAVILSYTLLSRVKGCLSTFGEVFPCNNIESYYLCDPFGLILTSVYCMYVIKWLYTEMLLHTTFTTPV